MYVTTSQESRLLDRVAMDEFGLPGIVLMENAARSTLRAALEFWPDLAKGTHGVLVLAGPGQNGGDGFVLARLLSALGHAVDCRLVRKPGREPTGDALVNYGLLKKLGLGVRVIESADDPLPDFDRYGLVIDAIFGTGLDRPLEGQAARVLAAAAGRRRFRVLAVDLPSGLSADSGEAGPGVLRADLTVSLGTLKFGLFLGRGPELCGQVRLGDIGLCPAMFGRARPGAEALDGRYAASLVPERPGGGHKGTFGHAVICGGSSGKTGALVLAALGAQRSGCGLVTAAHPASLATILEAKLTSAMTLALPESLPGEFSAKAADVLTDFMAGREALALGPGLGLGQEAQRLALDLATGLEKPLVLDADALTALAGKAGVLASARGPRVITPHPGEAGRLLGLGAGQIQADRPGAARALAGMTGAVVVLKGRHTLVAGPGGELLVNLTGGPVLGTGGTGDLLTGLTAGLLAQGLGPFGAAALAVHLHGLAADLASSGLTDRGLFPTEILAHVPGAWKSLLDIGADFA
ncbi:MAG: NAD(P)H-hydrate dehydratase [Deltaproteobacteria bacterium]|jgi:NAD(P)H-hydrate epimerase|nr:NAD(P)H-hydrate dehydratase [Deltaproteobacteria bacterium]